MDSIAKSTKSDSVTSLKPSTLPHDVSTRKEELSLQVETSCPDDDRKTVKESVRALEAKHPSVYKSGDRPQLDELTRDYPHIPANVLKRLNAHTEATIAITNPYTKPTAPSDGKLAVTSNVKQLQSQLMTSSADDRLRATSSDAAAENDRQQADACDSADVTPYVSMTDLSVKDKVKLLSQQVKPATK